MSAGWTERDDHGCVWLCWYEPPDDPRESRSLLVRTLIGKPAFDVERPEGERQ